MTSATRVDSKNTSIRIIIRSVQPMLQKFSDRLIRAIRHRQTPLVVGLDPRWENLPSCLTHSIDWSHREQSAKAVEKFCCAVVDSVASLVPAVKPQAAFFELMGPAGMTALWNVVRHAQANGLIVIMDAKRGDIGSTADAYARAYLGDSSNSAWACDSLTINPYLGDDSLAPFVERCRQVDTGIFVLVRTSNPGGRLLQELQTESGPMYRVVADYVQSLSSADIGDSGYGSIGAVVGATHPQQLSELRARMPNSIFLVPGIGAQGATATDIAGAFDSDGLGAVINSSRSIIFAYRQPEFSRFANDWQRAVEAATEDTIAQIAAETNAGRL